MPDLSVSPQNRRYGRKIPYPLPPHRMLTHISSALPPFVDLREWAGPIKNQGNEGSCTAHSGSSAMEWIFRRYYHSSPILSPQYLYAQELIRQGDFPNDNGSEGVTLCESMISKGCCEEFQYPYVEGQIARPTPEQEKAALNHRLGAYHGLNSSGVALSVLGDATPWPVEVGFTVYQSFESEDVGKTGVMPVPSPKEQTLGGHEVLALGYDIGKTATIRPTNCPPALLIQNSWGTSWGITGFFWMPLAVVDAHDTDLKIAHSGHPWVGKS